MSFQQSKKWVLTAGVTVFLVYSGFLYGHLPKQSVIKDEQVSEGKLLWQHYNCNACHQVYGLGGFLGPDLTNEYSLKGPAYIMAFLKGGTVVMPNFHLSEKEMNSLTTYLKDIDASGSADPRSFLIHPDGTIEQ